MSFVPTWQADSEATECCLCQTQFSFWYRKHHCRMCGRVVCGKCSPTYEKYLATSYVVTPPNQQFLESPHVPHRTCSECVDELIMIRRAIDPPASDSHRNRNRNPATPAAPPLSSEARAMLVQRVYPGVNNDHLGRCPVCDTQLFHMAQPLQEEHVDNCLKSYSSSPSNSQSRSQRKRMLISKLPEKECAALGDCTICFEDFEPGQKIGRLECMCVFHEKCILEWFGRKGVGVCPLHNQ